MSRKLLLNPRTGTPYFGLVPEAKARGLIIPSATIILRLGKQSGHGGYGAKHIWARHQAEVIQNGFHSLEDVPNFVARIITPGAPIHFEAQAKHLKITVVRSSAGIAILQFDEADQVYSVTTAYSAKSAYGMRIGQILEYDVPTPDIEVAKRPQEEPVGV